MSCAARRPSWQAFIGNTLRSFIYNVAGAWLYSKYAIMEQPATVAAAYGIPASTPNLGSMSGGLSPEGFLYGEESHLTSVRYACLSTYFPRNSLYSPINALCHAWRG